MDVIKELLDLELEGERDPFFIIEALWGTYKPVTPVEVVKLLRPIEDYFEYRNEFGENRKKVTDVIDKYVQTLR